MASKVVRIHSETVLLLALAAASTGLRSSGLNRTQRTQIDVKFPPVAPGMPIALDVPKVQEELCGSPKLQSIGTFDVLPDGKPIEPAPAQSVGVQKSDLGSVAQSSRDDSSRRFEDVPTIVES